MSTGGKEDDATATQPLISSLPTTAAAAGSSKPFPILDDPITQFHSPPPSDSDPSQYLQISFTPNNARSVKDLPFLVLFFLLVISTFAFGIFAAVHHNPNYSNISSFTYDPNSSSCAGPIYNLTKNPQIYSLNLYFTSFSSSSSDNLWPDLIYTLVITLVLSIPFALCLLLSLRHYTKYLIYMSLPFFVIVPIFLDIYWFVACTVNSSCSVNFPLVYRILVMVFGLLIVGVIVWIFVVNWHRIELTVEIIGVASDALWRNLGLFVALPLLTLGLFVYYVPIIVFLIFARQNGEIVPREKHGEHFCAWKLDSWVPWYNALAILTMFWSLTAMVEAQVYVISGTTAQWYFAKDESGLKRSIRNSLRNAFGPSFGTVCLSGLLVTIVRAVRAAVDSAANEDATGFVNLVLRGCVNVLLTAFDFLNKFTINFAAITGEAYCTSAKMTYELLKRNLLSAVLVEVVSTRLLAGIVFVLSALYAIVVCAILNAATDLGVDSYFVAVIAWVLLLVVLSFFIHVLDNVVDTVYICYAIDRDNGEVCKQDVHEVYVHLPISRNHNRAPTIPRTPLTV